MGEFQVRFTVSAEVTVTVVAADDEAAYEAAVPLIEEHLSTLYAPSPRGVVLEASIDGVGGDVEEVER